MAKLSKIVLIYLIFINPLVAQTGSNCELLGDANNDQSVNVLDVISTINIISGVNSNINSDCNGDNLVNILDIICTINIITQGISETSPLSDNIKYPNGLICFQQKTYSGTRNSSITIQVERKGGSAGKVEIKVKPIAGSTAESFCPLTPSPSDPNCVGFFEKVDYTVALGSSNKISWENGEGGLKPMDTLLLKEDNDTLNNEEIIVAAIKKTSGDAITSDTHQATIALTIGVGSNTCNDDRFVIKEIPGFTGFKQIEVRDILFNRGQQYIAKFRTKNDGAFYLFEFGEYVTFIPRRTMSVSTKPCDYNSSDVVGITLGTTGNLVLSVGNTLQPNQDYFLNIINHDQPNSPNAAETCPFNTDCGIVFKLFKTSVP